jgi:hypothetical protein
MIARTGRVLLILWQAWCLNVFLPAHTRGAMTVPDVKHAAAGGHACCAHGEKPSNPSDKPTPDQRSRCAVCYFAAGLTTPAVVDYRLFEFGAVEMLEVPPPNVAVSSAYPLPYYACGPPALG